MSAKEPSKGGRPPIEITEEIIRKAEDLAKKGLTLEQIASCLGMGTSTLYEKKSEYVEFAEAIKRGQSAGINDIANKLFEKASGGDSTCMLFYLKCRAGWSETQNLQHQGNVNITLGYYEPEVPPP